MIQGITNGIKHALNNAFGESYEIYPESMKQGLQEPCFFIKLLSPASSKVRGETYYRENMFCIHYFPVSKYEPRDECYGVLEKLYLAMEYIKVDGNLVRGVGMRGEIHEDILLFYVDYNVYVRRVYVPELMKSLETIVFSRKDE